MLSSVDFHVLATKSSDPNVSIDLTVVEVHQWWIISLLFFFIGIVIPLAVSLSFFLSGSEPFIVKITLIDVTLIGFHILRIPFSVDFFLLVFSMQNLMFHCV